MALFFLSVENSFLAAIIITIPSIEIGGCGFFSTIFLVQQNKNHHCNIFNSDTRNSTWSQLPGVTKRHHKIGRNPVSMVPRKWLSSIHLKIHRAMKNEKNLHRGIFLELGKSCKIKSETYLYPFFGILKGFFSWLMIQKKVYGGKKKNIFIHDRQVKHYEISFEGKIWFLSISFSRVESWKVNLIFH